MNCVYNQVINEGYYWKSLKNDIKNYKSEYNNKIIDYFSNVQNIKHILSSPQHPQTSGIVEVDHKEIRKNFIISNLENPDNFNLKLVLSNAVESHNSNIHTVTGYRSIDLIKYINQKMLQKIMSLKRVLIF